MIPNFDSANSTQIPSDPLVTYSIDYDTGKLTLVNRAPAGGTVPRQFSINKAGTLVAVGLQGDGRVVVLQRDPATGMLGNIIAHADIAGQVNCAIFDE
jgi:6-phosphogluconolactonase (cycloisomerase 2 family)